MTCRFSFFSHDFGPCLSLFTSSVLMLNKVECTFSVFLLLLVFGIAAKTSAYLAA